MTKQNENTVEATETVEPTETNEAVEQEKETDTTKVKVTFTNIKYFNEEKETVSEMKIIGKLTMIAAKKMVKELEGKNVLISKDNVKEEFYVNTVALYALKESA